MTLSTTPLALTQLSSSKCYGGYIKKFSHHSNVLNCQMNFSIFLPSRAMPQSKCPVLYFFSGLTCNEDNFITKAGAPKLAEKHGLCLVCPDTSPRGVDIEGQDDAWDFGTGAGFYVDATTPKWKSHYRMYSYVTEELPKLIEEHFPVDGKNMSCFGHSMGGHGALICALKNPGKYKSVSAFSPICNPVKCPWGVKAFTGYLGADNVASWQAYDASELLKQYTGPKLEILVDQGTEDSFLKEQLLSESLIKAGKENVAHSSLNFRFQEGYDHSYWFIQSFVEDHIAFHASFLC